MRAEDFTKIPIAKATQPPSRSGPVEMVINNWWAVTEDDCILVFKGYSKQCNSDKRITDHIISFDGHPGVKSVQIPCVYMKHNCHDYVC